MAQNGVKSDKKKARYNLMQKTALRQMPSLPSPSDSGKTAIVYKKDDNSSAMSSTQETKHSLLRPFPSETSARYERRPTIV